MTRRSLAITLTGMSRRRSSDSGAGSSGSGASRSGSGVGRSGAGVADSGAQTVIGVDVGGTKIEIAAMRDGALTEAAIVRTEQTNQQAFIEQLHTAIRKAVDAAGQRVAAVGLGIPSVIEFATGRVRSSVNVPLRDVPLREVMQERLDGLPVYVDNDATCAALAEAYDDQGRVASPNLVIFTVGTGVGGGIVIDGQPYRGVTGAAAELGHTIVGLELIEGARAASAVRDGTGASGGFPRRGSLESLASGRALDELARRTAATHAGSALAQIAAAGQPVSGRDLVAAAHEGDPQAAAAISLLGERLGVGIANAINTLDPEVVAIAGGASEAGQLLLDAARNSAWRFVLPGVGTRTEIRLARAGPEAGVRGAALLARLELARADAPRPFATSGATPTTI
jgi:glucokinase